MSDDVESVDKIISKIKKKYDQDSEGWRVTGGKDPYGNKDMFIQQAPNTWWLKSKEISPFQSIMYGKEIKNIDEEIDKKIRDSNMGKDELLALFGLAVPTKKEEVIFTQGIADMNKKRASQIEEKIAEKDKNASKNLRKQINHMFQKHYPDRETMYE